MGSQTDGIEWVLVTLFVIAMLLVFAAAIREIRRVRAGDPGGDPPPKRKGAADRDSGEADEG